MAFFDWNKNKKKDFGDDFIEYHIFREVMDDTEEDEAEPELYEDDMPELYDGNIPDLPHKKPKPIKYDKAADDAVSFQILAVFTGLGLMFLMMSSTDSALAKFAICAVMIAVTMFVVHLLNRCIDSRK